MPVGDVVTYKKLSASTGGKAILISATTASGNLCHTATTVGTGMDKVFLYAVNNHTASVAVTCHFGGSTDPNHVIVKTVPKDDGAVLVVPGFPLQSGSTVRVYAAFASVVSVYGEIWTVTAS